MNKPITLSEQDLHKLIAFANWYTNAWDYSPYDADRLNVSRMQSKFLNEWIPSLDHPHCGDCTKVAAPCTRCHTEGYLAFAKLVLDCYPQAKRELSAEYLLEHRHTQLLCWGEPWPSCGPEGNHLDSFVEMRATVHDCINMERLTAKKLGRSTMGNDKDFLLDFIAVHWAIPV